MDEDEKRRLEAADKVIHPVEKQWHFELMTKHGFKPETKEVTGLVRSYTYNDNKGTKIVVTTGYHTDRWEDKTNGKWGYWSTLKDHINHLMMI